jgi:hypothetical protein
MLFLTCLQKNLAILYNKVTMKEFEMRKIAGKIAMFLILVMLASMFTSCFTVWCIELITSGNQYVVLAAIFLLPCCFVLDLITWPVQLLMKLGIGTGTEEEEAVLTEGELAFLTEKTASLPEADSAFLMALVASLPETERASALEQISSVPEQRFASTVKVMRALYVLPQSDRLFLVETIRSLPEKEQVFLTETANSLTEDEIAALADDISSIPLTEMGRQMQVLRETPPSDWGYREYATERFVTRSQR